MSVPGSSSMQSEDLLALLGLLELLELLDPDDADFATVIAE